MKTLVEMHKEFLTEQSMFSTHGLPVTAQTDPGPVIPVERWIISDQTESLTKTYRFRSSKMKSMFIRFLMTYEEDTQHFAKITMTENLVKIELEPGPAGITEIDKEYARFADANFKDVVYNPIDE